MSMKLVTLLAVVALLSACGGNKSSTPGDDPSAFAVGVVKLITGNSYTRAWQDMHSTDQKVAPLDEYVTCEKRSPVLTAPTSLKVVGVSDESIGLGNGSFVTSKAVHVRMVFPGAGNVLTHTVHLVAERGHWKWILPSWRFRDYRADKCPTDAGSTPPPASA
jgi:hypothetical protein